MKILYLLPLVLAGCASSPPKVVEIPVPVQVPCPRVVLPPKPDLSALAALKTTDPYPHVVEVLVNALHTLAADDQELRALLGEKASP